MRKFVFLFIILTWLLTACTGSASQVTQPDSLPVTGTEEASPAAEVTSAVPTVAANTDPVAITTEGLETTPLQATEAPQVGTASSGVVDYALVPAESTITYEVGETFLNENNRFVTAVGKTQGATGDIQVNFDQPQATTVGKMSADISGFQSDRSRRDNAIRGRFLQSAQYPMVTFTPTKIDGLPEKIEPGVEYPLTLQGDLTIRETTRPATFQATVELQDGALTGQAVTTFLMSDYGFGPISILGILQTEDQVKVTVDFVAQPN